MPDLKSILDSIDAPKEVKASAWDAFHDAGDPEAFQAMFDSINLPKNVKADLWDAKYGGGEISSITPKGQPQAGPLRRFVGNLASNLLPLDLLMHPSVEGIKNAGMALNPIGSVLGITNENGRPGIGLAPALKNTIQNAKEEFGKVTTAPTLAEGTGHLVASALPNIGPAAARAGEQIAGGDVAGGLGAGTGQVLSFAGGPQLAAKIGGKLAAPISRALEVPTSKMALLEAAQKLGLKIPLDKLVDSPTLGAIRNQAEASIMGGAVGNKARIQNAEILGGQLQNVTAPLESKAVTNPSQVGKQVVEAAKKGSSLFHKAGSELYQGIEGKVDIGPVLGSLEKVPSGISPELDAVREYAVAFQRAGVPVQIPFEQAQALKSFLTKKGTPLNTLMKTSAEGGAGKAASLLTEQIQKSLSPEMASKFDQARAFWKEGAGVFGPKKPGRALAALEMKPQEAFNVLEPHNVPVIGKAKEAVQGYNERLGSPEEAQVGREAWDALRSQFIKSKILSNPEGLLRTKPDEMPPISKNLEKFGFAPIEELMKDEKGQKILRNLKTFGEAIEASKAPPKGWGYLLRRIIGGALDISSAGGMEAINYAITKGLYSPRTASLLIAGARNLPRDGGRLLALGVRMSAKGNSPTLPDQEDQERAKDALMKFGGREGALAAIEKANLPAWDKDHLKKAIESVSGAR